MRKAYLGVDIGSISTKAVIIDEDKAPNFANKITTIEVTNFGKSEILFKGSPSELLSFCESEEDEDEEDE